MKCTHFVKQQQRRHLLEQIKAMRPGVLVSEQVETVNTELGKKEFLQQYVLARASAMDNLAVPEATAQNGLIAWGFIERNCK